MSARTLFSLVILSTFMSTSVTWAVVVTGDNVKINKKRISAYGLTQKTSAHPVANADLLCKFRGYNGGATHSKKEEVPLTERAAVIGPNGLTGEYCYSGTFGMCYSFSEVSCNP